MNKARSQNPRRGSFEFMEQKMRKQATVTSFGKDFEKLCKVYLETSPTYMALIEEAWLWDEWPDKGVDLVCRESHVQLRLNEMRDVA
ncbi:MAG: hypothetical protein CMJ77_20165 [Planctomycetaceae bacterium]|nr:hypothetical protein [Planctomycetaceae bacterium]